MVIYNSFAHNQQIPDARRQVTEWDGAVHALIVRLLTG